MSLAPQEAGTGGSKQGCPEGTWPALGHEKAAIQGWLGQKPSDERQEPCAPGRKGPPRGLPMGLGCQASSLGKGRRQRGKTKLVFEAQGLKGGCVCPDGKRGCESLVALGGGGSQLSRTRGTMPTHG